MVSLWRSSWFGLCSKAAIALVLACWGRASDAQPPMDPTRHLPTLRARSGAVTPGTWVEYAIFQRASQALLRVRVVALGRTKQGQWLEVVQRDAHGQAVVLKALVRGSLARPKGVVRVVVQPPGLQPVELPLAAAGKGMLAALGGPAVPGGKQGGKQEGKPAGKSGRKVKVTVGAGTFSAWLASTRDAKGRLTRIWASDKVPGWPMVKATTPEVVLELTGYGKGGQSRIRGKPGQLPRSLLKQLGLVR